MTFERLDTLKLSEKSKVYLVFDPVQKIVSVEKRLSGQQNVYHRLKNLPHPYLPKLHDVRFERNETIIHEEYIPGSSLAQTTATETQLRRWLLELCNVLSFLHRNHILHRDIKPSNLLVGIDGHIRLIDFDAARTKKPDADSDTQLLGTRGYAPPEQYGFAQTDARADVYALGVTFQKLLGPLARKPRWRHILRRCTELEPKRRYRHVWQIAFAIHIGRFFRQVLTPLLALLLSVTIVFFGWSYTTDTDFKAAFDVVFRSRRDLIFDVLDTDALSRSPVRLSPFHGDAQELYRRISTLCPGEMFISTGYANCDGYLLFGRFTTQYNFKTGEQWYSTFDGLCYITPEQEVRFIPADSCHQYAPAVLALYNLNVFNTPLL